MSSKSRSDFDPEGGPRSHAPCSQSTHQSARLSRHLFPFFSPALHSRMAGDSFFAKPSSSKRKRPAGAASTSSGAGGRSTSTSTKGRPAAAVKRSRGKRDEELSSDDGGEDVNVEDMDLTRDTRGGESDEEERDAERRETGGEKRLRIAREYLKGLEAEQQLGASLFALCPKLLVATWSARHRRSCVLARTRCDRRSAGGACAGVRRRSCAERAALTNLHADVLLVRHPRRSS
jgi:hypothetical protein